jgi:GNAT superfamily N-acetyltransferase
MMASGEDLALLALADANVVAQWRLLGDRRPGGEVIAGPGTLHVVTGLPAAHFNTLIVTVPHRDPVGLLAAARALFVERGVPWCLRARGRSAAGLEGPAREAGMVLDALETAMVLHPLGPAPPPRPDLVIKRTGDDADARHHVEVVAAAFGAPLPMMAALLPIPLLTDSAFQPFLGEVGGAPVAASALVTTQVVAGIYNVGTLPSLQRRGLGTAMTWHALEVGRQAGCTVGALQATLVGRSVYERMGFRALDTWYQWVAA